MLHLLLNISSFQSWVNFVVNGNKTKIASTNEISEVSYINKHNTLPKDVWNVGLYTKYLTHCKTHWKYTITSLAPILVAICYSKPMPCLGPGKRDGFLSFKENFSTYSVIICFYFHCDPLINMYLVLSMVLVQFYVYSLKLDLVRF